MQNDLSALDDLSPTQLLDHAAVFISKARQVAEEMTRTYDGRTKRALKAAFGALMSEAHYAMARSRTLSAIAGAQRRAAASERPLYLGRAAAES